MVWVEVAPSCARSLRFRAKSWRVVSRVEDVAVGTFPASSWSSLFLSRTAWVRNRLPWLSLLPLPALFLLLLSLSRVFSHPSSHCFPFLRQGVPYVMKGSTLRESTAMASPLPQDMEEELVPVGSEPGTNG